MKGTRSVEQIHHLTQVLVRCAAQDVDLVRQLLSRMPLLRIRFTANSSLELRCTPCWTTPKVLETVWDSVDYSVLVDAASGASATTAVRHEHCYSMVEC